MHIKLVVLTPLDYVPIHYSPVTKKFFQLNQRNGGGERERERERNGERERERERVRHQMFLGLKIGLEYNK